MRVLLQGRIDLLSRVGGDTIITTDIKDALFQQGVNADLNTDKISDFGRYDLIHFFGIMRVHDLYPYFLQAKKQHKKIVITPIYEDLSYLDKYGRIGWERFIAKILANDFKELGKGLLRTMSDLSQLQPALLQLIAPYSKQQRYLLTSSHRIIVTSHQEANALEDKFEVKRSKIDIIPIGIDEKDCIGDKKLFIKKYSLQHFILSVGRIEPKKNQLSLLRALKDTKKQIVFIGNTSSYHKSYVNNFLKQLRSVPNAKYVGYVDRKMLLSAYAAAKVHVLASWFEVLGISSLEAAVNNCNIVTTNRGYAKEYFGNLAWYCDPSKSDSIKNAVIKAYNSSRRNDLKNLILEKYTWDKIIPKILEVYKNVLKK